MENKVLDLIEIQRHLKIIELSTELLTYLADDDLISSLEKSLVDSSDIVRNVNISELSVCNPTLVEIGVFRSSVKRIILSRYGLRAKYQRKKKKKKKRVRLMKACDNTTMPEDLVNKTILFRRYPRSITDSPIGLQVKESIKNEIIKTFEDKNKELILNYKI